jgi:hypothetical protein
MRGFNKIIFVVFLLGASAQGATRCFLHGSIESTVYTSKRNLASGGNSQVSDLIRLQMDATTPEYCEKIVSSYCRYNILDKQYVPRTVKAYFRNDEKPAENVDFAINKKCVITKSNEKESD